MGIACDFKGGPPVVEQALGVAHAGVEDYTDGLSTCFNRQATLYLRHVHVC